MRTIYITVVVAVGLSLNVNAAEPSATAVVTVDNTNAVQSVKPMRTHAFKAPAKMEMLRPGEVKPKGWLRDWCVTARNGYVSRMDEVDKAFPRAWNSDFHPRGKYLDWTDPDKGAWCTEGGAYWFEGLVRLAWELDDEELKAYAKKRLEPLLERMNPNAIAFVYWMDRNDPAHWGEIENANHGFIVGTSARTCRAFLAYYEATGDERALRAITWCLDDPRVYFLGNPCSCLAAACDTWRYSGNDKIAKAIDNFCATKPYPDKWPAMRYGLPVAYDDVQMSVYTGGDWRRQHGVLCFESMLSWIKASLWTGDGKYLANTLAWLDFFERDCLQSHGVIVADEQFGWAGPNRGTETCTVAGDIMLHTTLVGVTGKGRFADHVERSFFNAGAACTSRDFMHHVYFQTPNRVVGEGSFRSPLGPGTSGGVYKTKHWPLCCTAALTRILPGYVQWMWMKPASGGLAATLYAPNTLETELEGSPVRIETKTDYPFNETLEMKVSTAKPLKFPLKLRVPGWCVNPSIVVNGGTLSLPVDADGFAVVDREWKTGDAVSLRFPMAPKVETVRDYNDGGNPYVSLSYGPLLFAYGIDEDDENTPKPGVRTDWRLDSSHVLAEAQVVREAMPAKWNWPLAAPLRLNVKSADGEKLELVPYGCAKLRISMFPDDAEKMGKCSENAGVKTEQTSGVDSELPLKVLMIGNSFSASVLNTTPMMAKACGLKIDLVNCHIGGCTLKTHWENVEKSSDLEFRPYQAMFGTPDSETAKAARAACVDGKTNIPQLLGAVKWDVVTIQQGSVGSPFAETYQPYADKLIAIIRKCAPQAEILIQETWAYLPYHPMLDEWKMTQRKMYKRLHENYGALAKRTGFRVIPTGTAVERYRSKLPPFRKLTKMEWDAIEAPNLPDICGDPCGIPSWRKPYAWEKGFDPDKVQLMIDSTHLNSDGDYLQACVWLSVLCGIDARNISYVPAGVSADRAATMRECAYETVNESVGE